MFEIIDNSIRIKGQEILWGVKMTDTIGSSIKMCFKLQFGYCSNINKKWQNTENRKLKTEEKQKKRKADAAEYEMNDESGEGKYRP